MGRQEVRAFLQRHDQLAADIDLNKECERFHAHMLKGLAGVPLPDGMQMIPTYLAFEQDVPVNEPVIVMDAGGTNFRICVVTLDEEMQATIKHFRKFPMPGSERELSKDEFYGTIAEALKPYLEYSHKVGFCFSYACEILPNHDGRILNFSKEVKCPEAVGTLVGESLHEALAKIGVDTKLHMIILNDTVAALLGGVAKSRVNNHDDYVGLILGTGINAAYLEKTENIEKLDPSSTTSANMIINTEAGDYRIATRGQIDLAIDADSNAPGTFSMEKQISGRYQGLQLFYALREAVQEGLFSEAFCSRFQALETLESEEMDAFMRNAYGDNALARICANDDDRNNVFYLADDILERAAKLVAVIFCGIHMQTGKGLQPTKPLAITVEGTTYYKSKRFRHHLEYYVKAYLNEEKGYYQEFLQVENANLIGSAIATLCNED